MSAWGTLNEWFAAFRGLRQGCNLSPYLFNIMAEVLIRLALEGYTGGFGIGGILVTNLRYADDIVLSASSEAELQELINRVNRVASDTGMRVNAKKAKLMKVSDDPIPVSVTIRSEKVEEIHTFKYLGALFNSDAVCADEIKARLLQAEKGWAN